MKEEYLKHIVSTDENCTFLHRCFDSSIGRVIAEGLVCGPNPLSTTTWQPRELNRATGLYETGKAHGNCVIVLKIPRLIWEEVHWKSPMEEALDDRIGYFHEGKRDFAIEPLFVAGWIDRETNIFQGNF